MERITNLDYLIDSQILPRMRKERSNYDSTTQRLIDSNKASNFDLISKCYSSIPKNNQNRDIAALTLGLYLLKLFQIKSIPRDWIPFILEALQYFRQYPSFDFPEFLKDFVSNVLRFEVTFETLCSNLVLLKQLESSFSIDTSSERGFFVAECKTLILNGVNTVNDLNASLDKLIQLESLSIVLESTKSMLFCYIKNILVENTPNSVRITLAEKLKRLNYPLHEINEIKGTVEEVKQGPSPAGGLTKIRAKYVNTHGSVEVSIFECIKQGYSGRVALKECKSRIKTALDVYLNESNYLSSLSGKSPFFLMFYNSSLSEEIINNERWFKFIMEMEYIERSLLDDKNARMSYENMYDETEVASILGQLVNALNFLAQMRILHRDIKPSNIMITENKVIKIIDFNASVELVNTTVIGQAVGTRDYMAPEVRSNFDNPGSQAVFKQDKADVFSLGMTILFLLTKEALVDLNLLKNKAKLANMIESTRYAIFKPTLKRMLEFNVEKRPSLKELLENLSDNRDSTVFS